VFLGEVGTQIMKKHPDFDSRNYGYSKLTTLVKEIESFDIDERQAGKGNVKLIFIREKRNKLR
jgi:Fe-S-cluster formation regulator IscX/YfhJ